MNYLSILSLIAIAGGLYFFFIGFQLLARKRLLLATPTSRIRSAAMGLVEVNGMATGPHTIMAPISGKPCFLYRTTAWEQRERKKQEWEKVAEETLHLPFFLDDTTGKLLVEPLGADLDLRRDIREEYGVSIFSAIDNVPPRVNAFLSRHGVAPNRGLRIEEYSIKPEDALFIAGTLTENPGIEVRSAASRGSGRDGGRTASGQSPAPQVVRLYGGAPASSAPGMSQQAKIAAALNRAGITKPEAWSAAGVQYRGLAVEEHSSTQSLDDGAENASARVKLQGSSYQDASDQGRSETVGFDLAPSIVLMKGENDPTFVISFRSQKEFVSALAWKSAGMIWGGAAITLLGLYMLMAQKGLL
jgi:E3 Ubiquitin ligase